LVEEYVRMILLKSGITIANIFQSFPHIMVGKQLA